MLKIQAWAIVFVAIIAGGCARSPQAYRDKYLAQGRALASKKDYSRAILAFKNAAQAMPNDAEVHYWMGRTALEAGDLRTGVFSLRRAVELNPRHRDAQLKLAEVMAEGNEALVLQAERELKELVETTPVTPEMLNALAYSELRLGKTADATEALKESLAKSSGQLTSAILLAQAKLITKDMKGAEEVLQKASAASPKAAQPHVILGEFYRDTKRPRDAEIQLQTALTLDPNNPRALYSLAGVQYGLGRLSDAEATFQRLAALPEGSYKTIYALFLLRQQRNNDAVRELERLAKQDPSDRTTRTWLVSAYQLAGRTNDSFRVIGEALHKNPKDIDALVQRSQLWAAAGKYEDAEKDLNAMLRLQPDSARVHYFVAKLDQALRKDRSVRQELSKAVQLDPLLLSARLDLAQVLITDKDPNGALDLLNAAPESQKSLTPVMVQRNWAFWAMGDMAKMRQGIDAGLALDRSTDLLLQDGMCKLRSGNASEARRSLEEALKISPTDVRALAALKESYEVQKQTAEALTKVKEYASREPSSAPVQHFLGTILLARGDNAGARTAFQAAKAADPGLAQIDLSLIQVDILDGKLENAQRQLQAVVSANPDNVVAHLWLGNLEISRGDNKGAEEQFRKVVAADPENPQALNNLAYLLAEGDVQSTEALKYAQKAIEISPNVAAYSDTLGWILYHRALYPSAVRELERATAQQADPTWEYHLAMAYAKAGDRDRARAVLDTALRQNPTLPEAKLAQQVVLDAQLQTRGKNR